MPLPDFSYPIPRARLEGRSAEMAFADVVYCLVAEQGRPTRDHHHAYALNLNLSELASLSGLYPSTIPEEMDRAADAGWFKWTTVGDQGSVEVYVLNYAAISDGADAVHKPRGYVRNRWLRTLYELSRSYLPQRLLNVLWLMRFHDGPRVIDLDVLRAGGAKTRRTGTQLEASTCKVGGKLCVGGCQRCTRGTNREWSCSTTVRSTGTVAEIAGSEASATITVA